MMTVLWILGGIAALAYIGLPLVVKSALRLRAWPTIQPLEVDQLPAEAYEYFGAVAPVLEELGFEVIAYLDMPDAQPNVSSVMAWFVNQQTGQQALAVVIYTAQGSIEGKPTRHKSKQSLEFLTKLASGAAIATSNSADLGPFKKIAGNDSLQADAVTDIRELYRLHEWRERRLADPNAVRYLPAPGEEVTVFGDLFEETLNQQVGTGYFWFDASSGEYRMTLRGAYRGVWCELPPFKQVRRSRNSREAERQRSAAAAEPARTRARTGVRITHESPYGRPRNRPA